MNSSIKYVFLITVDCLRADYVGCIGGGNLTPNIDRLAKESMVFTRCFANGPGTNQSFPAIFTSTYFFMHGGMRLLPEYTTLAEVLARHGYRTVGFHSNPFLSARLGWGRGFQEFYDFMDIIKSPSAEVTRSSYLAKIIKIVSRTLGSNECLWSLLRRIYYRWSRFEIPYIEGRKLNSYVINWINAHKKDKFFVWLHYMDPHRPYIPPELFLPYFNHRMEAFDFDIKIDSKIKDRTLSREELFIMKELYKGEVRYVDFCIGKLIEYLDESGLLDDSLIILTGDHGEAFMEHGELAHSFKILYNEVIHVALILYGLENFSGKKYEHFVELLDIPPTILDILKIKKPRSFQGHSLLYYLNMDMDSQPIFSESAKPDLINLKYDMSKRVISCIYNKFKLIINGILNTIELYDLTNDFKENENLVEKEKCILKELMNKIKTHVKKENFIRKLKCLRIKYSSV